ncbi:MAG: DNA alkylation repair protein [Xanthomonadales bacterium]|jgi:3-methyladenine DNA glycosylase AlkD|nr:DNA alkylation repair protein [Xanthomonadales bacterium]
MTVSEVLALLEAERDERGVRHWERLGDATGGLRSVGLGLTRLRQLAKQIGRDRTLAGALWGSDLYEARVLALLIDDPAQLTRAQAEHQVEHLDGGQLAHVFASCDATLAKAPFVVELAEAWVRSADPVRRDCGHGLLYEISKFSGRKAPAEGWFLQQVERIAAEIDTAPERVRLAMGAALMGIGKRSAALNAAALRVAQATGPIAFTSASGECEPFDVAKHLSNERLRAKLGLA